jgi:hypothetical protein
MEVHGQDENPVKGLIQALLSVLDSSGQLGTARDSLGQLGTAWDSLGQLGTAWDSLGQLGTAWDSSGQLGDKRRARILSWPYNLCRKAIADREYLLLSSHTL